MTKMEKEVLEAIKFSEYHDGRNPIDNYVWSSYDILSPNVEPKQYVGVLSSLVKKGYANCSGGDTVCITQKGWDALNES